MKSGSEPDFRRRRDAIAIARIWPFKSISCFLAVALLAGCTALPPQVPPAPGRAALGRVAVVAGSAAPELRFEGFARGRGEGAAMGAGATFLGCVATGASGTCAGPYCGAVAVFWLGVCGVAGVVGGVAGATAAQSGEAVRAAETKLRAAMDVRTMQESLREQIEIAARAHGSAPAPLAGADTLLEATLLRAGTGGGGINAPIELRMEAAVRLLRAADGAELYQAKYVHLGERRKLAGWAENEGAALLRGLNAGYGALAAHIADSVFLLYPFPDQSAGSAGTLAAAFGLAPIEPPTRGTLTGDRLIGERFEWTRVDSLRPTLRWQAFPRPSDVAAAPAEMARVTDVTYELLIAREHELAPAEVVYRRSGLPSAQHRLEAALQPGTRYFWTVRARFEHDGATRVTGWGANHYLGRDSVTAPSRFSYRFRTP